MQVRTQIDQLSMPTPSLASEANTLESAVSVSTDGMCRVAGGSHRDAYAPPVPLAQQLRRRQPQPQPQQQQQQQQQQQPQQQPHEWEWVAPPPPPQQQWKWVALPPPPQQRRQQQQQAQREQQAQQPKQQPKQQPRQQTRQKGSAPQCDPNCADVQPPSHWAYPRCAGQLANGKCAERVSMADGYCELTCGICVAC